VLRHQDRLGADLERAQGGRGVRREERVAGPGREDDDAALLQVPDSAAPDVGLGDLGDVDRGENACLRAQPLEHVLERERVEHGREHPRIVRGRAVHALGRCSHAAVDVPRPHHDRDLYPAPVHLDDLAGDLLDPRQVEPVFLVAHQGLAGELEEHAPEDGPLAARLDPVFLGPDGHSDKA
jgi:hypothetical protein